MTSPKIREEAQKCFEAGRGLRASGRFKLAVEALEHCIELDPGHMDAHFELSLARDDAMNERVEEEQRRIELEESQSSEGSQSL